jgi:amino acid adenylation domain-containing protein
MTPDLREELAKHKPELLTFLNEADRMRRVTRAPIGRISREGRLLPSINQKRLWFIDQLQSNTAFNCYNAFRIKGSPNIAALEQGLTEIVRRHEALRTTFAAIDGEPFQIITSALRLNITLVDLRDILDATERETEAERIITEEVERPFDLAKGPLFRVQLLRLATYDHLLLLTMHHIVTDGWSMGILVKELTVLYEAFCNERPSPLPEFPIQYVDFAHWQSQCLQGEVLQQELSYWKERLKGAPEVTQLPTDYARPAVQNFQGASEPLVIPKSLTEALKTLSRSQGVTLFMTLLAAFKALLYRHTGQEDLVLGSPIAGRIRGDIENLIGLFINTLVLRTDLSGNPSFRELLGRVREAALEAYAHQEVPFEKLIEDLHIERSLSFTPLFQVMFVLQNTPESELKLLGSTVSSVTIKRETSLFDLFLSLAEGEQGLQGTLSYKTDLFDGTTITHMIGRFNVVLQGIVADPDRPISTLPFLMEMEKHQLLMEWNDTASDYPKEACIHQLFEAQVERTPDAVASVFRDQELTYRELNRRANQVAHYLRRLGVGSETLVGICMERSLEMVIGLLGILKAGGAYVPLDPQSPKQRLAFLLEDTQVSVLLTHQRLLTGLPEHAARVVCLEVEDKAIWAQSAENPVSGATADSLAYVIYTSGSTGEPKGVMISHRGICNRLLWGQEAYRLTESDRCLHALSLSFDFATWEIFTALVAGAQLIIAEPGGNRDSSYLVKLIIGSKITLAGFVPSMLKVILDEWEIERCNSLKRVVCGGEELPVELQERLFGTLQDVELQNTYGPTEASIDVTCWVCRPENGSRSNRERVPIGRPIANTQIYILDSHLQPVPVGVPGELHIAGVGLARGYLNRPDFTAEKFIPKPFSNEPGARLYKTGDLARYLLDGNIEFLGRLDHQVKVRGFRIELGEIEAVLAQHPGVRETVVLAREDATEEHHADQNQKSKIENLKSDKRLVAYVVPKQEPAPTINGLRSFLKEKLPEYMIPSAFVFLDTIPLTPNGKMDRKALPAPDQNRPEPEENYVAPRTPVEELLAEIWAEVLKLHKVGIRDNFFELGGHSLLATQVISRLCNSFKVEVPLRALFESPTVAGLAERIEEVYRKEQRLSVRPMSPVSREKHLLLSYAQQRLWFLDQYEPNSSVYNIPSALRLRGPLDVAALEQSLNQIISRHESLRTTFSMVDGEPVQVIAASVNLSLPVVDLRGYPETEREEKARRFAHENGRRPFDLSTGPLFRATLIRLAHDDHILVLTMHHIVSDGWSMGVVYRELSVLYRAFMNGKLSPLADLPIQYADFAIWQREWLQGEVLESQLSYWKKQLEGIPGVLNLPTDYPRPAVQSYRGARRSIEISRELTDGLKALSRKEGVTVFMTLLAAFQTLLYRYTGQEDIVVGSPIANRNRAEIEGLIGFFVNTLVLRSNLSGNPRFTELLARVREMALGAYAHQDLPFEKLVEELKPERSLSHPPFFGILFNMVNQADFKLHLPELITERFSFSEPESKFDLTLYVAEQKNKIDFNLVYRVDLFSQARMRCFLEQYRHVLEQIVAAPQDPIQAYSLVTPESRELLPDPSAVLAEPPQQLVTGMFSSWAAQTPNQAAISQGEHNWTYSELAVRAETLARVLRAGGLERGDVVAICGRRSFGLIAGMIGVLLSGGVLLPIDHTLPNQRKQLMLNEAGAKRLLYVGDKHSDDAWLEENFTPSIVVVNPGKGSVVDADTGLNLELVSLPELSPNDPAYIFFTSGTTGIPKGVLGCHKGLSHFLNWQRETFGIGSRDRSAQLTALSFDAVLRDIFLPLTSGATLCLPEFSDAFAPDETIGWLEREQISILHTVPSVAQWWLTDLAEKISLPSLRWVFFVGEPLTDALVLRWRSAFENAAQIVNLYGPTETTLVKCFYRVPADMRPGVQPVGAPITETQALVLGHDKQLCGVNEPGEIVLRTPFRSLGYINAPEENGKRFVKNPFRDDAHDLIYFTGDAGRYAPDGTLEILGRLDDQVKIRGVRIEPAEVTAILSQHPLVDSCIVVGRKDERAETCLVAYVVAEKQRQPTSTQLRFYLLEQLPAAMVPSAFVFLDSLPLTPNGKVDRKALSVLDHDRPELEESFVAPRTVLEETLVAIWAKVLKSGRIGVHENFFDLGGHSLLATQVASRIREALDVALPLRVLFEKPTVASLSDYIESVQWARKENSQISEDNLGETEEIIL